MKRIIIDCDPGQEDAIALLLAVCSPEELDLVAATTVAGNASDPAGTRNARAILEAVDRTDVPVHRGCVRPLLRPHAPYFDDDHGLPGSRLPKRRLRWPPQGLSLVLRSGADRALCTLPCRWRSKEMR